MATYNSGVYAQQIGSPTTAAGITTPVSQFTDGKRSGGRKRAAFVQFDTSKQNLLANDIINLCTLPPDVIVTRIQATSTVAATNQTLEAGIPGTANYFSSSAVTAATEAQFDLFTNYGNYGTPTPIDEGATSSPSPNALSATTTVTCAVGANQSTGIWSFLIEFLSN
jgi:hypothetical protein